MTDWVRVKHADTHLEYTVTRAKAKKDPKLTILDKQPAADVDGRPLDPISRRPKSEIVTPKPSDPKETK